MALESTNFCGKLDEIENYENGELLQELDFLKEIYITELSINYNSCGHVVSIDVQLHPATGENVHQKWVCLVLQITPSPDYPHSVPEICIRGPRGLADEHVASLRKSLFQIAEDRKGGPMMYELIEFAKESLTQLNVPYGCCMICLEDFDGSQKDFMKTDCYHYFHCSCLAVYIDHCNKEFAAEVSENIFLNKQPSKQLICPVCREALADDLDLSAFQPVSATEAAAEKYLPSAEMLEIQQTMASLYEKQKQKGGIIDLEEEKNKYLLPKDFHYAVNQQKEEKEVNSTDESQSLADPPQNGTNEKSEAQKCDKSSREQEGRRDYGSRRGEDGSRRGDGSQRGEDGSRRGDDGNRREDGRRKPHQGNRRDYDYSDTRKQYGRERRKENHWDNNGEYGMGNRRDDGRVNQSQFRKEHNRNRQDRRKPANDQSQFSRSDKDTMSSDVHNGNNKETNVCNSQNKEEDIGEKGNSENSTAACLTENETISIETQESEEQPRPSDRDKHQQLSQECERNVSHRRREPYGRTGYSYRNGKQRDYNGKMEEETPYSRNLSRSDFQRRQHSSKFRDGEHSGKKSETQNGSHKDFEETDPQEKQKINDDKTEGNNHMPEVVTVDGTNGERNFGSRRPYFANKSRGHVNPDSKHYYSEEGKQKRQLQQRDFHQHRESRKPNGQRQNSLDCIHRNDVHEDKTVGEKNSNETADCDREKLSHLKDVDSSRDSDLPNTSTEQTGQLSVSVHQSKDKQLSKTNEDVKYKEPWSKNRSGRKSSAKSQISNSDDVPVHLEHLANADITDQGQLGNSKELVNSHKQRNDNTRNQRKNRFRYDQRYDKEVYHAEWNKNSSRNSYRESAHRNSTTQEKESCNLQSSQADTPSVSQSSAKDPDSVSSYSNTSVKSHPGFVIQSIKTLNTDV